MNTQNKVSPWKSRAPAFLISLLYALLIWPALVEGQIRSGAAFLQVIPGARQQGLAGSLTGAIDDLYAVYANPGTAGFLREWQWSATYTKWFADIYSASLFYGHRVRMPWSNQTRFGLGVAYQGMPEFNSTRQTNIAAASASDLLVAASIGQPFQLWGKNLALGANVKYFRSELAQYDANAWVFDTGLLYRSSRFRFLNSGNGLFDYGIISAGVAMTQLGQSQTFISQGTPLPRTFRAGIAFNTGTHTGLQLQLSTDYKKIRDEKGAFSLGTELMWNQLLALRGGYDFSDRLLSHLAFGLSLRLDDMRSPITSVIPGRNNALRLDLAAMEDSQLFERTYRGSVTHHPIGPEGFQFMEPPFDAVLESDSVRVAWEATKDPDLYDGVTYWLVVDQDSAKIANTVNSAKQSTSALFQTLESTPFFISQRLAGTDFRLRDLQGGEYFAAVLAYDQDRHLRFAKSDEHNIQRFRVAFSDIEITNITFEYSPWITEDDYQGRLQIAVKNSSQRLARNISIALDDSTAVALTSTNNGTAKSLVQTVIPQLAAGAVDTVNLEWRTAQSGLHHLIAQADMENRVREMNEKNNRRSAAFYTIPKGRFATDDTVAIFTLSRLAYEVPFIAEIYFDRNSAVVQSKYFHQSIPGPQLKILAQRLKTYRDLKASLQGFADPNSGEREVTLANGRAEAVRDSLINLGVNAGQISLVPGEVLPMRRTPANADDARWVSEERRYVKIITDRGGEDKLFELIAFDATDSLPSPVVFGSTIKGAVPLKAGVVNVEAGKAQEKIDLLTALHGAGLQPNIDWQPNPANGAQWAENDIAYTLALTDSLNRQFRTQPRQAYLIAPSVLREQRVAWPMQFARTDPLYDFYWDKLLVHINRLLADPDMRMRFSGHACAIGPDAVNQRLSEQRASAFRENFLLNLKTRYPQMHDKILLRLDQAIGY
ncbi:MAG: PorV/PorQ family protein, partial [bacterium]